MKKMYAIILKTLPIVLMVSLIPLVSNDYTLTVIYILITGIALTVKREKNDGVVYLFGLIIMTISETFFLMTEVETFTRTTLFGIMPLWLPFLWAYGFVAIKHGIKILETKY